LCAEGPWFQTRLLQGKGQKQYCYIDAVDPDQWLLRSKGVSGTGVKWLASYASSVSIGGVTCLDLEVVVSFALQGLQLLWSDR
jgi:hypothetical protein